jgi:hypothetical protein
MVYSETNFLKAIESSFKAYKEKGARSTAKIKPVHKFVAETLEKIWGKGFEIRYLGEGVKEAAIEGKYYSKNVDIAVLDGEKPVFCLGIKFVTSNYKQNANNYFENMMGETANIQAIGSLPYAQLIILRHETPYYKKTGISTKIERINDKDISKYLKLLFDIPQAHRPHYLGILLINIDEDSSKVSATDLEQSFSKETAKLLYKMLSIKTFFDNIYNYKDYYILQG